MSDTPASDSVDRVLRVGAWGAGLICLAALVSFVIQGFQAVCS